MKSIGSYEVLGLLGDGGMGSVYKGRDPRFDRPVAIKILHPHYQRDRDVVDRFKTEAVIQAKLSHPNIVGVLDFITDEGSLAMVMEFIEGRPLDTLLKEEGGRLEPERALALFSQVLAAIGFAHDRDLVHRDIKPANVMIQRIGKAEIAKVTDFGIAKLIGAEKQKTKTGAKLGTVAYMSPEHVRSPKYVDARSDIYSLGVMLYEMLAGKTPFEAETEFDLMRSTLDETPELVRRDVAGIPADLRPALLKSLAKDPEQRFDSCEEFQAALDGAPVELSEAEPAAPEEATLGAEPAPEEASAPEPSPAPVSPPLSRRPAALIAAVVIAVAVVAGGLWALLSLASTEPAPPQGLVGANALVSQPQPAQPSVPEDATDRTELRRMQAENLQLEEELAVQRRAADAALAGEEAERARREDEDRQRSAAASEAARLESQRRRQRLGEARSALTTATREAERMRGAGQLAPARDLLRQAQGSAAAFEADLSAELVASRALQATIETALVEQQAQNRVFEKSLEMADSAFADGQYPLAKELCDNLLAEEGVPADLRLRAEQLIAAARDKLREAWADAEVGPAQQRKIDPK